MGNRAMFRTCHSGHRGFTLIELMVVTAILALVIGVIVTCLASGIRVWDTASSCAGVEGPPLIQLAILEKDVARMVSFHAIPFSGSSDQMAFAALISRGDVSPEGEVIRTESIGTVKYFLDPGRRVLLRKQWLFPKPEPPDAAGEEMIGTVEEFRLQYGAMPEPASAKKAGAFGSGGGAMAWSHSWSHPTNVPGGLRMDINLKRGSSLESIRRTFLMPEVFPDCREKE